MSVRKQTTTTTHNIEAVTMEEEKISTNRPMRPLHTASRRSQDLQNLHFRTQAAYGCWILYTERQTLIADDAGYPNFENWNPKTPTTKP
jgi:hypothetical protein